MTYDHWKTTNPADEFTGPPPPPCERHFGYWRPIKTAPKDGTRILLWSNDAIDDEKCFLGRWRADPRMPDGGAWWEGDEAPFPIDADPDHWMSVPNQPEDGLAEQRADLLATLIAIRDWAHERPTMLMDNGKSLVAIAHAAITKASGDAS